MTEQPASESTVQESSRPKLPEKLPPQPRRPRAPDETNTGPMEESKPTRPIPSPVDHKPGIPEAKRGLKGNEPVRSHAPLPKVNPEVRESNRTILLLLGGILSVALLVAVGNLAYSKGHADGLHVSNAPRPSAVMPIGLAKELEEAIEQLRTEGFPLGLDPTETASGRLRPFEILVAKAALETGILSDKENDETRAFLEVEGGRTPDRKDLLDALLQARERGDREEATRLLEMAQRLPLASPAENGFVWDTISLILELEALGDEASSAALHSRRGLAQLMGQAYIASRRGERSEAVSLMKKCQEFMEPEAFQVLARDPAFSELSSLVDP